MTANGEASTLPTPSPFANVSLAIDSYTLDAASGKRRLRNIEPDGTLTFDEPKPPRVTYGEDLNRIWNEYPGGLMDLSEEKLLEMDTLETPEDADKNADTSDREKGELLSPDEMETLRSEVCNNLNMARNELWYIFELAKTLAASSGIPSDPPPEPLPSAPTHKKGKHAKPAAITATSTAAGSVPPSATGLAEEGPILPAGTYTTTHAAPPTRTDVEAAHALELAIAAKQQALEDCSALIDAAVDELRLLSTASDQWSSDIHTLRLGAKGRGQWAIVPKPDFGRTAGHQTKTAMDVVIPYALDEAPAAVHARSLAAFDLDPRKAHILAFGARSYRRLRVMIRTGGTGGPRTASKTFQAEGESERGVCAMMEAAQLETLDEELFNEIRAEALRLDSAMPEQQSIALPLGKEKITFQLYDTRESPSPTVPHSPVCDALLAYARLGLLHTYRRRKQRIIEFGPSGSSPHAASSILVPLVHIMQFYGACRAVSPTLDAFRSTLAKAGLETTLIERHAAAGNHEAVLAFLAARAKIDVLGTVYTMELAGCPGITVNITAPNAISVVTQRSSFVLRDTEALGSIVADALVAQLAPWLYDSVQSLIEDDTRVFFDELDGVLVLDAYGALTVSIPPPFNFLTATFDDTTSATPYDSRNESGSTLVEWLTETVKNLPARDE